MPNDKTNKFFNALNNRQQQQPTQSHEEAPESAPEHPPTKSHYRPSRDGTKHVGGYFDPAVSKMLRQIALDEDTSVQTLVAEALNMLFQSRQKPTIAPKRESVSA